MKVSVILIDWGVRESFHSIYYLNKQDRPRDDYEIIWLEYSNRKVDQLQKYYDEGTLDQYIVLEKETKTYNKHVAWNEAVVRATGDIVVLCDSDAIFKDTFITNVNEFFDSHDLSFLMIDEIRSNNRKFWPFSFPTWEEVLETEGVSNWDYQKKKTVGIAKEFHKQGLMERITKLNYGACFCVKRSDYIQYGGLDEHETYNGYICGPYELAFRLLNAGFEETWHESEYLLHTYHPWIQSGFDLIGPHYCFNSLTSIKNWFENHKRPIAENGNIAKIRNALFPINKPREPIRLSVICLGTGGNNLQRFRDTLSTAYSHPLEVIDVEDGSRDSLHQQVKNALSKASGELVMFAPANTIFHANSIDRFLNNFLSDKVDIGMANVTRTDTDGYDWYLSPEVLVAKRNACEIAVLAGMLRRDGTLQHHTFKEPIFADIWADTAWNQIDHEIVLGLNEFNDLANEFRRNREPSVMNRLCVKIRELITYENNDPGTILHHCWLGGVTIHSIYASIALFRELGMKAENLTGLELVMNSGELLLKKLERKKADLDMKKWVFEIFYKDFNHYIALCHFHLGRHFYYEKNSEKSQHHLNRCLLMMPDHREAKLLLSGIPAHGTTGDE